MGSENETLALVRLDGDFPHAGASDAPRKVSFILEGGEEEELTVESESDSSIVATLPAGATKGKLRATVDERHSNRVALPSANFAGQIAIQKIYHRSRQLGADTEIVDFHRALARVARELGVALDGGQGFRAITNAGEHGVQEVPHFHMHILGGRPMGRMVQPG